MTAPRPLSAAFLSSSATGPALRVGILVDGLTVDRAGASIVDDLLAAAFVELALVVVVAVAGRGGGNAVARSRFARLRREGGLVFAAFGELDHRRAGVPDDPAEPEDVSARLAGVPTVRTAWVGSARPGELPAQALDAIRAAELDVLVCLSERRPAMSVGATTRRGVWGLALGPRRVDSCPAALLELADRSPVCAVELRASAPDGTETVLDRAVFPTFAASLARTRAVARYGSTHLVVRNLRLLHERGWPWLAERGPAHAPPAIAVRREPVWLLTVRWFVPLAIRRSARRIARSIGRSDHVLHWRIGIRVGHAPFGLDGPTGLDAFRWLEAPKGRFWADPFPFEHDGQPWLFFEDYRYDRGRAALACGVLTPDGELAGVREILATDAHLSYPVVVATGEGPALIPESSEQGEVRLFRSTEFPDQWEPGPRLLAEPALDTTVICRDGRWWLFATVVEPRGGAGVLMLFSAEAIHGPWVPHPLNPVSQDVRTNRNGGGLFLDGDRLVRPSQDGSRGYGYRVTLNEVRVLSEIDFAEVPGPSLEPDGTAGLLGVHTYNRLGAIEVIDGKVARSRRAIG